MQTVAGLWVSHFYNFNKLYEYFFFRYFFGCSLALDHLCLSWRVGSFLFMLKYWNKDYFLACWDWNWLASININTGSKKYAYICMQFFNCWDCLYVEVLWHREQVENWYLLTGDCKLERLLNLVSSNQGHQDD